jgi:hypothetical protein
VLVVVDPDSGKAVQTLSIGEHADGMATMAPIA